MADAGVTLKFFGDTASANAAIAKLESRLQSLENAQKQGNARVKASAAQSKESMSGLGDDADGVGRKFASMVGPLALVATAVRVISSEWDNVIERQQKAGQSAVTFEQALGESALNVGAVMSPEKMKARALKMSAATGVAPATAVQALSLAIKSGGATTEAEAERLAGAAEVAGKLSPRASAEKLADTAGSIASFMARTGGTAEQGGGLLLSMQGKSNIADANRAMAAMGPTLANMLAQGASPAMAQALAPALSQAIEDTQGDVSSLAATQFTTSLTDAFGGRAKAAGRKDVPDFAIEQLRADPQLARDFFQGDMIDDTTGKRLGKPELGRGKAETFFRAISGDKSLAGDDKIIQSYVEQFENFKNTALTNEQAGGFYQDRLSQVRGATPTVQVERETTAAAERNRISSPDAMRGVISSGLEELLQSSGMSWLGRKASILNYNLGGDPSKMLRVRAQMLRGEEGWNNVPGLVGGSEENKSEARRLADNLERAAIAMEESARRNPNKNRNGNVENVENN